MATITDEGGTGLADQAGALVTTESLVVNFPGRPPNALGFKAELNLNGTWTDITAYVMLRDQVTISGMGRADETGTITASSLTLTLRNDGRFTPRNSSSPYYPNIVRNCQVRISVNAISATGTAYNGYRFFGEISSWPPGYDISQRDTYARITASGIWRRIQAASTPIGSAYWRYVQLMTGLNNPAAYWAMEDGNNSASFVLSDGTGTNLAFSAGTPSFAADAVSFPGSDALPQFSTARVAANVSSAATPTNNVIRFALSVPAAGDSTATTFASSELVKILTSGTIARISVSLAANQLSVQGFTSGGASAFGPSTISSKVNGAPVLVSVELTPSGSSINWAMRIIKPGAGSVLGQVTGTRASTTIAAVTQVQANTQGRFTDTAFGQLGVWYVLQTLTSDAAAIAGNAGETASARFTRLCAESNIPSTLIGSGGAAMGPQVDGKLSDILQGIESTDGGMLFETRDGFGLGYRTLASMQNQAAAVTVSHSSGALGAPLTPTYDDALLRNQVTVTNWDGYAATATLSSGALSVQMPPNGAGPGYTGSAQVNANTHAQVNALAQQLLFQGTVDDVRYPVAAFNFQRAAAAPFFATVPGLRLGDRLDITSLPAFLGGGSTRQLAWGYTERLGGDPEGWTIEYNTIPELPFETGFSPGTYSVGQVPSGATAFGGTVGSTVAAFQLPQTLPPAPISARGAGGAVSFIAAATPYDWAFTVTGTPSDATYFSCTQEQAFGIAIGDTFRNSGGLGGPFTVTSVELPPGANATVHFTPDASSVMSTGTVTGGKEGDTWVNTSAGNQLNQWSGGQWVPITWDGTAVINTGTINAGLIAAGTVIAGVVNGTVIMGASIVAYGTSGEILVYSGTPVTGNLIGSWSGLAGNDGLSGGGNPYPAGLAVEQGGLVLLNQGSAPAATSGASTFYSSLAGRPRYLSQALDDSVLDRSTINVSGFTPSAGNTIAAQISAQMNYKAGEASQSSEFEIEIDGLAQCPSAGSGGGPGLTFGFAVDGVVLGGSCTVGATVFPVGGNAVAYTVRSRLAVLSAGSGGTCFISTRGAMDRTATNAGNATIDHTPFGTNSGGTTKAFDTTVNHTFQLMSQWGSTTQTGHSVSTYMTRLTRRM